jgi:hypothetical protein
LCTCTAEEPDELVNEPDEEDVPSTEKTDMGEEEEEEKQDEVPSATVVASGVGEEPEMKRIKVNEAVR